MNKPGSSITNDGLYKAALIGAVSLILFWLFIQLIIHILPILELFTLGLLISLALNRPIRWLEKHGLPRTASVILLFLFLLTLLSLIGYLLVPPVIAQFGQFADSAPAYWARAQDLLQSLGKRFPQFAHTLNGELLGSRTTERIIQILSTARTFAMGTAAAVLGMVALVFILIFTILNPGPLVDGLLSLFPIAYANDARTISKQISDKLTIWVEGTFITMFSVGLMCWLGLMILGVDFPVLFGIIAGLLEVIPTIGPVLSAIPPMAVALIDNPIKALYVAILYTAVQQVESNLLVPYVMSTKLRLHPLSLLFAILVLASLLGIFGALIATPTVAVIKVLYEEIYLNRVRDGLNSNNHSMNKE